MAIPLRWAITALALTIFAAFPAYAQLTVGELLHTEFHARGRIGFSPTDLRPTTPDIPQSGLAVGGAAGPLVHTAKRETGVTDDLHDNGAFLALDRPLNAQAGSPELELRLERADKPVFI